VDHAGARQVLILVLTRARALYRLKDGRASLCPSCDLRTRRARDARRVDLQVDPSARHHRGQTTDKIGPAVGSASRTTHVRQLNAILSTRAAQDDCQRSGLYRGELLLSSPKRMVRTADPTAEASRQACRSHMTPCSRQSAERQAKTGPMPPRSGAFVALRHVMFLHAPVMKNLLQYAAPSGFSGCRTRGNRVDL
jgi:hypothetical protein